MRHAMLIAPMAALLLASGATVAQAADEWPEGYRWHEAVAGQTVQFGIPESDDRALRIDCRNGRVRVSGPLMDAAALGDAIQVILGGRTYAAEVTEAGDGLNFSVTMTPTDPAVVELLAGRPLAVGPAGAGWTVPGAGAPAALGPVIEACGAG